jgi:capsular polysaccharide transport system permease protein
MDGLDIAVKPISQRLSGAHTRLPLKRRLSRYLPFGLVVIVPALIAAIYLFAIASDQYVSEARFVVRGPNQQSPNAFSSLLQTAGVSRADDDTYAVQDFITSRDALHELMQEIDVKAIFTRPEADLLSRFSTFSKRGPFEHLYKFYTRHVGVEMDTGTGVSKLTVKSFRAADSHLSSRGPARGAARAGPFPANRGFPQQAGTARSHQAVDHDARCHCDPA